MTRRSLIGLLASSLVSLPAVGMAQEEPGRNPGGAVSKVRDQLGGGMFD